MLIVSNVSHILRIKKKKPTTVSQFLSLSQLFYQLGMATWLMGPHGRSMGHSGQACCALVLLLLVNSVLLNTPRLIGFHEESHWHCRLL